MIKIPILENLLARFDHRSRDMLLGSIGAFSVRGLGIVLNFLFSLVISRSLGAEGAGVFFLGLTMVMLAAVIGRFGFDNAVIKFVAQASATENSRQASAVLWQAFLVTFLLTSLLAVAIWSQKQRIAMWMFDNEHASTVGIFAWAIVPVALLSIIVAGLNGRKKIAKGAFAETVLRWLLALGLFVAGLRTWGAAGAATAFTIAAWLALPLGLIWWLREVGGHYSLRNFDLDRLLSTAGPMWWIAIMSLITRWIDTLMIGWWLETADVGRYSICYQLASLQSFVLLAVAAIAGPKFAELWHRQERAEIERQARLSSSIVLVVIAPILLIMLLFPVALLGIFGEDFRDAAPVFRLLVIGQGINVATGAVGLLLLMTENEKVMRNLMTASTALNVILNAVLIPRVGILGAAIASAACFAVLKIGALIVVYRRLSIAPLPFLPALHRPSGTDL